MPMIRVEDNSFFREQARKNFQFSSKAFFLQVESLGRSYQNTDYQLRGTYYPLLHLYNSLINLKDIFLDGFYLMTLFIFSQTLERDIIKNIGFEISAFFVNIANVFLSSLAIVTRNLTTLYSGYPSMAYSNHEERRKRMNALLCEKMQQYQVAGLEELDLRRLSFSAYKAIMDEEYDHSIQEGALDSAVNKEELYNIAQSETINEDQLLASFS